MLTSRGTIWAKSWGGHELHLPPPPIHFVLHKKNPGFGSNIDWIFQVKMHFQHQCVAWKCTVKKWGTQPHWPLRLIIKTKNTINKVKWLNWKWKIRPDYRLAFLSEKLSYLSKQYVGESNLHCYAEVVTKISVFLQQKSSRSNIFTKGKTQQDKKNITTFKVTRGTAELSSLQNRQQAGCSPNFLLNPSLQISKGGDWDDHLLL